MNYRERQEKEIKTIKERTVKLNLSDADCERIARYAGKANLTVGELLENFIGDLVGGTYSNGSDERDLADQWYERCGFGMFPEKTLLRHILENGEDMEDFITACDEKKYYEDHPEEYAEEIAEAKENGESMLWFEQEYHSFIDDFFEENPELDIETEIDRCRKWQSELEDLQK